MRKKFVHLTVRVESWMPVYLKMVVEDGDYKSLDTCLQAVIETYRDKREDQKYEQWLIGDLDKKLSEATKEEWEGFKAAVRKARQAGIKKKIQVGLKSPVSSIDGKRFFTDLKKRARAKLKEWKELRAKGLLPKPKTPAQLATEHRKKIREAFRRWKAKRQLEKKINHGIAQLDRGEGIPDHTARAEMKRYSAEQRKHKFLGVKESAKVMESLRRKNA
jgi:DNA primase large subunit